MDPGTSHFYATYAAQLANTESGLSAMLPHALSALPAGAWVLDVGAGSGRDVAALRERGFEAFGVEPHAAMRETALRLRPTLAGCLADGALPRLGRPFSDRRPEGFDAVLCSAVLMHMTPEELPLALAALAQALRPKAAADAGPHVPALLLSLPELDAARLHAHRDGDGRRFHNHAPATVQAHLDALGFALASTSLQDHVRASTGTRWHTLLLRKR